MRKLKELAIIETALDQWEWSVDLDSRGKTVIQSDLQVIEGRRETDYYRKHKIYEKAGVPFTIYDVGYIQHEGLEVYEEYTKNFSDACYQALDKGRGLLIAGGFCTYLPGITGGIQRCMPLGSKLGVVFIDGHADIETPEITHSHIVAGMPAAAMLGLGLEEWRKVAGMTEPILSENFIMGDYHARSEADDINIKRAKIDIVDENQFKDLSLWNERIRKMSEQVDAIFLHVDVDILARKYVPAFKFPIPENGQEVETVMQNIKTVMDTNKVIAFSIMDVCFTPKVEGAETTYKSAAALMSAGLENWKEIPDICTKA